jgi:hypothetical protein
MLKLFQSESGQEYPRTVARTFCGPSHDRGRDVEKLGDLAPRKTTKVGEERVGE